MVDGERELPLLFGGLAVALFLIDGSEKEVRLDHTGVETRGLLDFGLCVGRTTKSEKSKAIEIVKLGGFRIGFEARTEGLDCAVELFVAGIPASEDNDVVCGGVGLEAGDEGCGSITRRVRRGG